MSARTFDEARRCEDPGDSPTRRVSTVICSRGTHWVLACATEPRLVAALADCVLRNEDAA